MAYVSVRNCKNKSLAKKIKSIANFSLHRLMSDRLANQIAVTVNIRPEVIMDKENGIVDHSVGTIVWEDAKTFGKEYTMELSLKDFDGKKFTQEEILKTCAHECVHIKQYARGETNYHESGDTVRHKGFTYSTSKISYWEYPWEIEAYGRELGLYELWKESLKPSK